MPPPDNLQPKDSDGNYLATCQAPETVENGRRPGAVDNFISITVLSHCAGHSLDGAGTSRICRRALSWAANDSPPR